MLAQDYPRFEVVAVDDRSTDKTLEVLKEIARRDPRLKVIEGAKLPPGWIGKPWALEQARRASVGEWLLATDADMVFQPPVLRHAIDVAQSEGYSAVTLAPDVSTDAFWAKLVMPIAAWLIMLLYPLWRVNNPRSEVAIGVGGFFLMRRDAHASVGGYEAIRADVVDDVKTARLLKRAGHKIYFASAPTLLWTPMYSNLKELFEGFGKNSFEGSGASLLRTVTGVTASFLLTTAPLLTAILCFTVSALEGSTRLFSYAFAGLAAYLAMVSAFVPIYKEARSPARYALLSFVAHQLMSVILLYSAWRMVTGRGVVWKSRRLYGSEHESPASGLKR